MPSLLGMDAGMRALPGMARHYSWDCAIGCDGNKPGVATYPALPVLARTLGLLLMPNQCQ